MTLINEVIIELKSLTPKKRPTLIFIVKKYRINYLTLSRRFRSIIYLKDN